MSEHTTLITVGDDSPDFTVPEREAIIAMHIGLVITPCADGYDWCSYQGHGLEATAREAWNAAMAASNSPAPEPSILARVLADIADHGI